MIIGFSGKMGVGKSTAVKRILEKNAGIGPGNVVGLRFAKGVYACAEAVFQTCGLKFEKEKARGLLQYIGTDWGRAMFGEDFWVNRWKKAVAQELLLGRHVVVEDVRFNNEAEAIKSMGGRIIHIDGKEDNAGVARGGIEGHASEAGIDPKYIDATISNKGTERAFLAKVDKLWSDVEDGWV